MVHGNRPKGKRDEAIKEFREGRVWCLVVTEVLARGMDFRGVKVVVNYGELLFIPTFLSTRARFQVGGHRPLSCAHHGTEDREDIATDCEIGSIEQTS